jgi:hypothetical protein
MTLFGSTLAATIYCIVFWAYATEQGQPLAGAAAAVNDIDRLCVVSLTRFVENMCSIYISK